jgi:metal iron transporter
MRSFDQTNETYHESLSSDSKFAIQLYRPTLSAIKSCMSYSIAELCITLFLVAVFVNSAILIVAAARLTGSSDDLHGLYDLFVGSIGQASGTIFAFALLFSGISAGIVATLAGQLICEGAFNWRMKPFLRRLLTRSIAIIPAVIIAAAEGQSGLAAALNGCNVVLSVALIFLTFPLILYTSRDKYMRVKVDDTADPYGVVEGVLDYDAEQTIRGSDGALEGTVSLANNWTTTIVSWFIWVVIAAMNVATLTFLGLGIGGH